MVPTSRKIYAAGSAFARALFDVGGAGVSGMAGLAMVLFIALFAFGGQYFGWSDPEDHVPLALFSSFIFGIICGFRIKG
jgi:ABC-type Fe3+-siderophore transport system permease subunit